MADYWIDTKTKSRICNRCWNPSPYVVGEKRPKRCPQCRTEWRPRGSKPRGKKREKSYLTPTRLLRSEPGCEHILLLPVWDDDDRNQLCPFAHELDAEVVGWEPNPKPARHNWNINRYTRLTQRKKK